MQHLDKSRDFNRTAGHVGRKTDGNHRLLDPLACANANSPPIKLSASANCGGKPLVSDGVQHAATYQVAFLFKGDRHGIGLQSVDVVSRPVEWIDDPAEFA